MKAIALLLVSVTSLAACKQSAPANNAAANVAAPASGATPANTVTTNTAAPVAPAGGAAGAVTPDQFAAMLRRDGARQAVQALWRNESSPTLGQVYEGISSGNDQWLAVVPLMSTGTDGDTSESLTASMVEALPRNAAGVLRVIADPQTNSDLKENACNGPDQNDGPETRAYYANAIRAVEAVTDPALQTAEANCLAELRDEQA